MDEAEVGFVHREFHVNILIGNNDMSRHGNFFVGTLLFRERELFRTAGKTRVHPFEFAKF